MITYGFWAILEALICRSFPLAGAVLNEAGAGLFPFPRSWLVRVVGGAEAGRKSTLDLLLCTAVPDETTSPFLPVAGRPSWIVWGSFVCFRTLSVLAFKFWILPFLPLGVELREAVRTSSLLRLGCLDWKSSFGVSAIDVVFDSALWGCKVLAENIAFNERNGRRTRKYSSIASFNGFSPR